MSRTYCLAKAVILSCDKSGTTCVATFPENAVGVFTRPKVLLPTAGGGISETRFGVAPGGSIMRAEESRSASCGISNFFRLDRDVFNFFAGATLEVDDADERFLPCGCFVLLPDLASPEVPAGAPSPNFVE